MENNVENVRYHTDKIAILLATYNGEQYLQEQLDSLLSQTCQDWVTYIHDDGSTDQTMKVIECVASGESRGNLSGDEAAGTEARRQRKPGKRDTTACIYGTSCCGWKAEYDCGDDECVSAAGM